MSAYETVFDPCPESLRSNRVASFKSYGESGTWVDVSGNYTLVNNGAVGVAAAQSGQGFIGPATVCDYEGQTFWQTDDPVLIRSGGVSFTKLAIIATTRGDFNAQTGCCQFLHGISEDNSSIVMWDARTFVSSQKWATARNGTFSFPTRTFDFSEPALLAVAYDAATAQIRFQAFRISDSTELIHELYSSMSTVNAIAQDTYGRTAAIDNNSDYFGSQTVIDGIQIFDSPLTTAQLELICGYWRTQQNSVNDWNHAHRSGMMIDVGQRLTNRAQHLSARWRSASNPQHVLDSLTVTQNDILILPDAAAETAQTGATVTTQSTPATIVNGNGFISVSLSAADTNLTGPATIVIAPAEAIEQRFRVEFVSELDQTKLAAVASRLTGPRAEFLDKLNVAGELAHSGAAAVYKADVSDIIDSLSSRLGTSAITVVSHQLPGAVIVLVRGDSYRQANGRPLQWTNTTGAGWPADLTGATITFTAIRVTESGPTSQVAADKKIVVNGYVQTASGADQQVGCELQAADTNRQEGLYNYDVEATLPGGEVHTLVTTARPTQSNGGATRSERNSQKLEILPDFSQ